MLTHCIKTKLRKWCSPKIYKIYRDIRYQIKRHNIHKIANRYNKKRKELLQNISKEERVNIIFFVHSMGYWKYNGLLNLLNKDKRYNPIIIPFIDPLQPVSISKGYRAGIEEYCRKNFIQFHDGYDFENNEYEDLTSLNPHIIIYTHPYNNGYVGWRLENFLKKSIFIYTPYGVSLTKGAYFYDQLLTNIAWKIFTGSKLENEVFKQYVNHSRLNTVVTGFSIYDDIMMARTQESAWGFTTKIKIIWAPHHSIDDSLSFASSNFERICDEMIDLTIKYSDVITVAFKPHPLLKTRLYQKWGEEKTNKYYDKWKNMSNTFVAEGEYAALFAQSDALIHDCASFACEYLITGKPAFYICEGNLPKSGIDNKFGLACFAQHYHGYSAQEIETFIINTINGKDPMKQMRQQFVEEYLVPPNQASVAENMYSEINKIFNH